MNIKTAISPNDEFHNKVIITKHIFHFMTKKIADV